MDAQEFYVEVVPRQDAAVVRVGGELCVDTAPMLKQTLADLLTNGQHHLVLNLTATSYIDSMGIGVLIGALRRVRQSGGNLVVGGSSELVRRLLGMLFVHEMFPMYPSEDDALGAFG